MFLGFEPSPAYTGGPGYPQQPPGYAPQQAGYPSQPAYGQPAYGQPGYGQTGYTTNTTTGTVVRLFWIKKFALSKWLLT